MNSEQLQEWLTEVNNISDGELVAFVEEPPKAAAFLQKHIAFIQSLVEFLVVNSEDESGLEPLLQLLFTAYRRAGSLRVLTLQFIPSVIYSYLVAVSQRRTDQFVHLETFLLAVYNEEILDARYQPKNEPIGGSTLLSVTDSLLRSRVQNGRNGSVIKRVDYVRVPSMRTPSIYHDPGKISQSSVPYADSALLNRVSPPSSSIVTSDHASPLTYNGGSSNVALMPGSDAQNYTVKIGPYPSVQRITRENRYAVLTRLLRSVNCHFVQMHMSSVGRMLCRLGLTVARSGFHFPDSDLLIKVLGSPSSESDSTPRDVFQSIDDFSSRSRIPVESAFMLEVVNSVYYCLFSGTIAEPALKALDAIHQRACFEMLPDVLLVTNAVINSLLENPSGTPQDREPMGIRVQTRSMSVCGPPPQHVVAGTATTAAAAASPDGSAVVKRRTLVTNASLRVKRMPEDIPIRAPIDAKTTAVVGKAGGGKSPKSAAVGSGATAATNGVHTTTTTTSASTPFGGGVVGNATAVSGSSTPSSSGGSSARENESLLRKKMNMLRPEAIANALKPSKSEVSMEQLVHNQKHREITGGLGKNRHKHTKEKQPNAGGRHPVQQHQRDVLTEVDEDDIELQHLLIDVAPPPSASQEAAFTDAVVDGLADSLPPTVTVTESKPSAKASVVPNLPVLEENGVLDQIGDTPPVTERSAPGSGSTVTAFGDLLSKLRHVDSSSENDPI